MRFGLALASCLLIPTLAWAETGPEEDSRGRMRPFRINGYELSGAEFRPYAGDAPFRYPRDVLRGFHPDAARSQAVDCAWIAYLDLQSFLRANPKPLQRALKLGATHRFSLRINDYGRASASRSLRSQRLELGAAAWSWESTLAQDGTCLTPQGDQIALALKAAIRTLLTRHRTPAAVTH